MGRWISRDPKEENAGANIYEFVLNNPIDLWDFIGLESGSLHFQPGDEKHPMEPCDENASCAKNVQRFLKWLASSALRLNRDFTDEYRKLALKGARIPKPYNPNVKFYDQSWNNHIDQINVDLNHVGNCISILNKQNKTGKCRCCDKFFPKRFRWRKQEYDKIKQKVPDKIFPIVYNEPQVIPTISPETKQAIETGVTLGTFTFWTLYILTGGPIGPLQGCGS